MSVEQLRKVTFPNEERGEKLVSFDTFPVTQDC